MVNEETRRKVIISILNVNSQKGATLLDIKSNSDLTVFNSIISTRSNYMHILYC